MVNRDSLAEEEREQGKLGATEMLKTLRFGAHKVSVLMWVCAFGSIVFQ
jgi:hypothetical protein